MAATKTNAPAKEPKTRLQVLRHNLRVVGKLRKNAQDLVGRYELEETQTRARLKEELAAA